MKLNKRNSILSIVAVYVFIFIPIIMLRYPDLKNEFKYLVISKDMIDNSNYLIMRYLGELYPDKPPIFFWILIFFKKYFGGLAYNLTLIFGCLIPSMITHIRVYLFAEKFWDSKKAFMLSMALTLTPYLLGISAVLRMDALMNMFIVLALTTFYSIYYGKEKASTLSVYSIYIYIGLGILVKGGGAFAVSILAMVALILAARRKEFFKEIKILKGIGIVLLIVGIWLISLYIQPQGKEYVSLLLGQETLGRAIKSKAHVRPFYYYFINFPIVFLPMTPIFLIKIYKLLRDIKSYGKWSPMEKIGFTWFLTVFIFFSLLSGKLEIYMVPAFIPAMILSLSYIFTLNEIKTDLILKSVAYFFLGVYILFWFALPVYTDVRLAKPIVEKIHELNAENIVSYRFPEGLNLRDEVGIEKNFDGLESLDTALTGKDTYIVTKTGSRVQELINTGKYEVLIGNNGVTLLKTK